MAPLQYLDRVDLEEITYITEANSRRVSSLVIYAVYRYHGRLFMKESVIIWTD